MAPEFPLNISPSPSPITAHVGSLELPGDLPRPPSREGQGEQLSLRLGLLDSADSQQRTAHCMPLSVHAAQASKTGLHEALWLDELFPQS